MRDLSPTFAAAVAASAICPAILVFLDFEGAPVRLWTGIGSLSYEGETWLGMGNLASVEPLEEYSEIRSGSLGLSLNSVPNHLLSEVTSLNFQRRAAEIHLALFHPEYDNHTLIGVNLLLRGTMDTITISRAPESSTIKLSIANELARLRDSWGALYTDPHQRAAHPGDSGLRFIASLQDLEIRV